MGWNFRKSFKVAPGVRINLSKRGVGMSAGVKGARIGCNSRGVYTSTGIPGTGIYRTDYIARNNGEQTPVYVSGKALPPSWPAWIAVIGLIFTICGAVWLGVLMMIFGIGYYIEKYKK